MKKILYSSLLLVGLVASYEMNATGRNGAGEYYKPKSTVLGDDAASRPPVTRAAKSGEMAAPVNKEELVQRVNVIRSKIKNNPNITAAQADTIQRAAHAALNADSVKQSRQEAHATLGKLQYHLTSGEEIAPRSLVVVHNNLKKIEDNL